jgi:hypothetical protein
MLNDLHLGWNQLHLMPELLAHLMHGAPASRTGRFFFRQTILDPLYRDILGNRFPAGLLALVLDARPVLEPPSKPRAEMLN